MSHKQFTNLLDIRDFCVRVLQDHKDLVGPGSEFYFKNMLKFIKSKGYTKLNSVKSLEYLRNRVVYMSNRQTYIAMVLDGTVKKNPVLIATSFHMIKVEDNHYYVGSIKDKDTVFIIVPHFFHRFEERLKCASLQDAIGTFMAQLLAVNHEEYKVPGSVSGEILVKLYSGVALAHKTSLGIQGKAVIFLRTFISNEMLTPEQKALINFDEKDAEIWQQKLE